MDRTKGVEGDAQAMITSSKIKARTNVKTGVVAILTAFLVDSYRSVHLPDSWRSSW